MTKIICALVLVTSLMACGKKKPAATPTNTTTETQNTSEGAGGATGGTTYGGAAYGTPAK